MLDTFLLNFWEGVTPTNKGHQDSIVKVCPQLSETLHYLFTP